MLLLNLVGILALGSFSCEVAVASDDLDDTLKQALFLVKLLKSDFSQILRSNDEVMANSTEEENSTCSLPSEEFNSTMAMTNTEVTVSRVTPSTLATPPPSTLDAPPAPPNVMPPVAPMMMPYASWPPMAMGYPPPSGSGRRNFPDENYRFPYRLNRRRMMPDYYYFDSPIKSRGTFRRFENDPTDDLGNTPATSQAPTTSTLTSATSEATTLHVEGTTASTASLSTTQAQPSTSILPTTEHDAILRTTISANRTIITTTDSAKQSILTSQAQTTSTQSSAMSEATTSHVEETTASRTSLLTTLAQTSTSILPTTISGNHTIPTTTDATKQSSPADASKQTILTTNATSILLIATSTNTKQSSVPRTEEPKLPKIKLSTRRTKHRKRVGHRKRVHVSKATTTVISNRNENYLKTSRHHLRHRTHNKTTTEKWTKDDFEMSEVASELKKELEGTNTDDVQSVHTSYKDSNNLKLEKLKKSIRTTTTMKVFLQGSSRIPIPFPENNGFCHFHPENALCGAI